MGIVSFKRGVKKVEINNAIMYAPCMILDSKEVMFSSQGKIVMFETKKQAEEFNED